ncbi:MAG: hypothetical protein GDA56_17785 [Hormoscilla sp. GM7CHS1pb]|nr:hypothetical protein [Hormoscilla sp. GM7CHS1pb]
MSGLMVPCYRSLIGSSPVIYGKRIAQLDPYQKTESPGSIEDTKRRELNALPVSAQTGEQVDISAEAALKRYLDHSSLTSDGQSAELDNGIRAPEPEDLEKSQVSGAGESLKILLCRALAQIHGGQFSIQGNESLGYLIRIEAE